MPTLATVNLRNVRLGADMVEYLEKIDATLEPFGGRCLVHGATIDTLEGEWPGMPIIIVFPDSENAEGWYRSPAYQTILPLRTDNAEGAVILVDTVSDDHRRRKC